MIKVVYFMSLFFLLSCVASPRYSSQSSSSIAQSSTSKYISKGKSKDNKRHNLKGVSSWYGPNFHGKLTANGEVFDQYGVTAAHKTLSLGTVVRVTNLDNNKTTILRINDRGPYVGDRILDCSYGAALKLGFKDIGTANVLVKIIEIGDGVYMHHNNK